MFSGQLPHYIEPRKLADQGGSLSGETTVSELPRLNGITLSPGEPVRYDLRFARQDEESLRIVEGTITATLSMTCQRCLDAVAYPVQARVCLALVFSEDDIPALPERYDPWLITDERMSPVPLLEEELLLALPLVAMHEQCPTDLPDVLVTEDEAPAATKAENPFAILASLKNGRGHE
ncbi:YceD family protein [Isoalcanivorax beigongshangi]|uniref:Large ribosomal RNA subunit accumulation protein YceD n=1 Tax=Isoalcanivorax beigongshangi TaxID=3238810 RepID=A0ABV4AG94_9GAMM